MPDLTRQLLESRSALLFDVSPLAPAPRGQVSSHRSAASDEDRLLVASDLTGTLQLYELSAGDGMAQLTDLPDPVSAAAYVPGTRRVVVQSDRGGNERHQLYLLELDGSPLPVGATSEMGVIVEDPAHGHQLAGVAPDGTLLAYVSNRSNDIDFDVWIYNLSDRSHRRLYAPAAWCQPASGFSPDGRWLSVSVPGRRPLDDDLVLVEVATGDPRTIYPHPDEAAQVGPPRWAGPQIAYIASSVGSDQSRLTRYEVETGLSTDLEAPLAGWDATAVTDGAGDGFGVLQNCNGAHRFWLSPGCDEAPVAEVPLPEPGVLQNYNQGAPRFSPRAPQVYYNLSTPRSAPDIWCYNWVSGHTRRLTTSPAGVPAEDLVRAEAHAVESFDGLRVPVFLFRPAPTGAPPPAVVLVHGGPESQAMLNFNPVVQSLVAAGFGVLVPNVRGSTGYGKRYAALDDTTRRLDSVRDLAAVHASLAGLGLDPARAGLWGGSYGGYMVLAGLAFQPELWAAGVDIVGISDLVTFLQNTSDYRRAHREREYGSLARDGEFLASASPLRHASSIRAPLFVIHGRNDPRVPVSETEQLVAQLRAQGNRCELEIYEDEGHGLARLANRQDAYPKAISFLSQVVGPGTAPTEITADR